MTKQFAFGPGSRHELVLNVFHTSPGAGKAEGLLLVELLWSWKVPGGVRGQELVLWSRLSLNSLLSLVLTLYLQRTVTAREDRDRPVKC